MKMNEREPARGQLTARALVVGSELKDDRRAGGSGGPDHGQGAGSPRQRATGVSSGAADRRAAARAAEARFGSARGRVAEALEGDCVRVRPWPDPAADLAGHDSRSWYVETFWTGILGPSTVLLARRLAGLLERHPAGVDVPAVDLARALGLAYVGGRHNALARALGRAVMFNVATVAGGGELQVRRRLPSLPRRQLLRLPASLRDEHLAWERAQAAPDGLAAMRRRARQLAMSLTELGEDESTVEAQLVRWRYHPALAHESARWASVQRQQVERPAGAASTTPAAAAPRSGTGAVPVS